MQHGDTTKMRHPGGNIQHKQNTKTPAIAARLLHVAAIVPARSPETTGVSKGPWQPNRVILGVCGKERSGEVSAAEAFDR